MRHRNKVKTLDRKAGPRKALIRGLATNLVVHGGVTTTEARAKVLRPVVEKLVTKAKRKDALSARRELMKFLYTKKAVDAVMNELAPKYKDRNGGYTRIIKIGFRQGDGAKMSRIEFI